MTSTVALAIGAMAPDLQLRTGDGEPMRLSDLWRDRPALLVFLRHYG